MAWPFATRLASLHSQDPSEPHNLLVLLMSQVKNWVSTVAALLQLSLVHSTLLPPTRSNPTPSSQRLPASPGLSWLACCQLPVACCLLRVQIYVEINCNSHCKMWQQATTLISNKRQQVCGKKKLSGWRWEGIKHATAFTT